MLRLLLTLLFSVVVLQGCAGKAALDDPAFSDSTYALLQEVRRDFTINGEPVHPFVFRDFGGLLSDRYPIIMSIDILAGNDSNYYFNEVEKDQYSYFSRDDDGEYYEYTYYGSLDNGLLVAVSRTGGAGSGVFTTLHLIDLFAERGYDYDGETYERIILKSVGQIVLGDRWYGEISLDGNTVVFTTASGEKKVLNAGRL